jgi:hypothetical protein
MADPQLAFMCLMFAVNFAAVLFFAACFYQTSMASRKRGEFCFGFRFLKIYFVGFFPITVFFNLEAALISINSLVNSTEAITAQNFAISSVLTALGSLVLIISGLTTPYLLFVCTDDYPIRQYTFDESRADVLSKLVLKIVLVSIRVFEPRLTLKVFFMIGSLLICSGVFLHQYWRPWRPKGLEWTQLFAKAFMVECSIAVLLFQITEDGRTSLLDFLQHLLIILFMVFILQSVKSKKVNYEFPQRHDQSAVPEILVAAQRNLSIIEHGSTSERLWLISSLEKQ